MRAYKVTEKFRDKETLAVHKAGEVLTLSDKRSAEILEKGAFIQAIELDEEKDVQTTKTTRASKALKNGGKEDGNNKI